VVRGEPVPPGVQVAPDAAGAALPRLRRRRARPLAHTRRRAGRLSGKPPQSPYPPDLPEEPEPPPTALGDLVDVVVEDADWANEQARGLTARRVELHRCRLTGVEIAEASLTDVTFVECRIDLAGLRRAKLERVAFRDCRMGECDLYDATLRDVVFERCELRDAVFESAGLTRVELRGCELGGLRGVEALRGVRMPWNDVLENAPLFAQAVGIEIVD
jgi:hypothetical protein